MMERFPLLHTNSMTEQVVNIIVQCNLIGIPNSNGFIRRKRMKKCIVTWWNTTRQVEFVVNMMGH